eukprot:407012-Prorocentrum_lima.AAC.1
MASLTPGRIRVLCTFCDNPDDIMITVRPGAQCVHVLQLVQAPSGHLLLPCTDYAKMVKHKKIVDFVHSS